MITPHSADAIVVGAGLVGLAVAQALADSGADVLLLAADRPGEASPAAAGLLAPSVAPWRGPAQAFAVAAREFYPEYLAALQARTGVDVPLDRRGILELAPDEAEAARLRAAMPEGASWVDRATLEALEPELGPSAGALFHPHDGAVDNLGLIKALERLLAHSPRVRVLRATVERVALHTDGATVDAGSVGRFAAGRLVLAAGAWAPALAGLPRRIPVEPVRGEIISVAYGGLRHVVLGGGGYAVPREGGQTLVGATSERAGFDASLTDAGVAALREIAAKIAPPLGGARMLGARAGLRPMTPDLLPILGPDPDWPALLYACGQSRNGILMAPLTGACLAAIAEGGPSPLDLSPFRPDRFSSRQRSSSGGSGRDEAPTV